MNKRSLALMLCFLMIYSGFIPMSLGYIVKTLKIEQPSRLLDKGKTLYVGGDGPSNYSTIQEAINDASDGDTVYVYDDSSPYKQDDYLLLNKSIKLIGENTLTTEIYGEFSSLLICIVNDDITISGFTIQHDEYWSPSGGPVGIFIDNKKNIKISNNFFKNCVRGIANSVEVDAHSKLLDTNILRENYKDMQFIEPFLYLENISIENNLFYSEKEKSRGIFFTDGCNIKITNNTISNVHNGIRLMYSGYNYIITGNTIKQNNIGIRLGNDIHGSYIFHNNFISNTVQAYDHGENTWDDGYPSGGNYWDDYTGEDNDEDGIGDTPYYIPGGNNIDRYPLMEPFVEFDPNAPPAPDINGPTRVKPDVEHDFSFVTTDPNSDNVYYYICWGDGTSMGWIGLFNSSEEISLSHSWAKKGVYTISAKVKDTNGLIGPWGTLSVTVPRTRTSYWLRFFDMFTILQKLLDFIN